jgi:uncharacterized protein YbaP (TraB family)
MKKYIFLLIILTVSLHSISQQKSLLWEISGNGLNKTSYLYGTMHVSKKVAFRLDDIFYKSLNESECVALESDPTQWLKHTYEDLDLYFNNTDGSYRDNYYSKLFKLNPVKDVSVRSVIRFDNNMINGYLYRKNSRQDNFEEETYLDMFIYQAGKKNGKPIVGLEDIKESRFLTTKARYNVNKKEPDAWFTKLMKKENRFLLMENVYRDRNVELLDSIGEATNTNFYREHMLFKRNENMVTILDSLMHKKKVFAGVGAAHLGGQKGMLQMLKDKGYTVKALTSKQTEYAKQEKNKLEELFKKPELQNHSTPDGFITLKSFDKLREFSFQNIKYYVAPDMTNGAYLTINRLNRFQYIPSIKDKVNLEDIKFLLYEDIPGDIIKEEELTSPFPGISVLNRTKKGDYQKYHIYMTPLEIIVIKFGGKKDYVLKYESEIFDSIKFKNKTENFTTYNDSHNKYSFDFPQYYITDNIEKPGKKLIQSFVEDDYYFFQESPRHDLKYIEEDDFEAKFIHSNFYNELEIEDFEGKITTKDYSSFESSAIIDSVTQRKIWLKTVVKDGSYYILGYSGFKPKKAYSYFNTFNIGTPKYKGFRTEIDTSLHFKVKTTTKSPMSFFFRFSYKRLKPYDEFKRTSTYTSKSNERVRVTKTKYHDLQMFENADSLWNNIEKQEKRISILPKQKKIDKFNEKRYVENGNNVYSFNYQDSLSHKKIMVKYIQKKGTLFKLQTLVDNVNEPSAFVTTFFKSFKPVDSLLGIDIFKDKTTTFFDALEANDSIVIKGFSKLKFKKKDVKKIASILQNFDFQEDKEEIKLHLINQLIKLDESPQTKDYINSLYLNSYTEPEIQISILNALLNKKDKISMDLVLDLMKADVPIGSRNNTIRFYNKRTDFLEYATQLYPEVLQFAKTDHKSSIHSLLVTLVDSNLIKPKHYRKYKQDILNDAKTALKQSFMKQNYNYYKRNESLDNYTKLLFPFKEDKYTSQFYDKLIQSDNIEALTTLYVLLSKNQEPIPSVLKNKTLYNIKAQAVLVKKLEENNLLTKDITDIIDLKTYAKSKILTNSSRLKDNDSLTLYKEQQIKTDKDESLTVFIFKSFHKETTRDSEYLHFIAFKNNSTPFYDTKPYYISKRNGSFLGVTTTEEELIKKKMLAIKHKTRKRVNKRAISFDF